MRWAKTCLQTASLALALGYCHVTHAAPAVTGVAGPLGSGTQLTIQGTGFGTKSPAAPLLWDDFEGGQVGQVIQDRPATIGQWHSGAFSNNVFYTNERTFAGNRAARHPFTPANYSSNLSLNGSAFPVIYMEFRRFTPSSNAPEGNYKAWRWYGRNDEIQLTVTYLCGGGAISYIGDLTHGIDSTVWGGNHDQDKWEHYQAIYKASTPNVADGTFRALLDGSPHQHNSGAIVTRGAEGHINQIRIGHYFSLADRGPGCPASDGPALAYTDDVYIDTTWARVEIGNAASYGAITKRATQIPTSWSSSSITVSGNVPGFTAGEQAYLYVHDSNDQVNNIGFPVTVGATSTDSIAPSAPQNLRPSP